MNIVSFYFMISTIIYIQIYNELNNGICLNIIGILLSELLA